jgi:uncharacterized protein
MVKARVVLDTNLWISYAFFRKNHGNLVSVVQGVLDGEWTALASSPTMSELHDVMTRSGWERYSLLADRLVFVLRVSEASEHIAVSSTITACRDPKDNKFLELAVDGDANFLITGDQDLLALADTENPAWSCRILTPREFIESQQVS